MVLIYAILCLAITLDSGYSYTLDNKEVLKWPTEYYFKGDITNLFTGIIKPFELWYSESLNNSRIDYYGGLVKQYFLGNGSLTSYKIYPYSFGEGYEIMCREEPVKTMTNILKKHKNITYIGQKFYDNQELQVWKLYKKYEEKQKIEEVTYYVYKNNEGFHIPVMAEKLSHNLYSGSIDDHVVMRWYDFKKVNISDLDVELVDECYYFIQQIPTEQKPNELQHPPDFGDDFYSFKMQHNKKYDDDKHETRRQIFEENLRHVTEHNQKNLGYRLAINKFSDLTPDEFSRLAATRIHDPQEMGTVAFPHTEEEIELIAQDLPENYDMRLLGFISSVKNQGYCGSCWAFATVAAVEGAYSRTYGSRNLDLSEQSFVDCAWGSKNMGCDGGFLDGVYPYIVKYGIPTEEEYGLYLEEDGICHLENMTELIQVKGFSRVPPLSIDAMKVALYKYGPVTVTINSTPITQYHNGIFYDPTCNENPFNHAVTIVGYGVRDGVLYWIVKNSWGEDWGMDGYILFSAVNNNCHILENAYYPIF